MAGSRRIRPGDVQNADDETIEHVASFANDPLGFVLYAFPWGQPGTSLAREEGPDIWQVLVLNKIAKQLEAGNKAGAQETIRIAIASGNGIGKSALISFLILWMMATRFEPHIVVTANTKAQLTNKTWRQLSLWHRRCIVGSWFRWTATKFYLIGRDEHWFAEATPWSENKAQSMAGTHGENVMILFDEASQIPASVFDAIEGALTQHGAIWCCFGNPTEVTGPFFDCFHRFRHRWTRAHIDSRTAKMATNKAQLAAWVKDYGEDSDFVRIHVKGQFPRAGTQQLITFEDVEVALSRADVLMGNMPAWKLFPVVLSVDVAWMGTDQSVILCRQGPKIHKIWRYRGVDPTQLGFKAMEKVAWCRDELDEDPQAIFVDAVGLGSGVYTNLTTAGYDKAIPVIAGNKADDPDRFFNKRMENWQRMKEWLLHDGVLPSGVDYDQELVDDLTGPQYRYARESVMQLERKEDMKDRGLPSPDAGDALANSFSTFVVKPEGTKDAHRQKMMERLKSMEETRGTSWMSR